MKMASTAYNEVTHTQNVDVNSMDPLYKWEAHFPERMSKLHLSDNTSPTARRQRNKRNRNAARFKTQPITFDEIKEVDEESNNPQSPEKPDNIKGIKSEFAAFSRSMDGLLPGRREKTREPSTDSNKENNPAEMGAQAANVPAGASVLSSKSNSSTSSSSSTPQGASSSSSSTVTSANTVDPVSGAKIPAGLPSERDSVRMRRKPRKKAKSIVEESTEPDRNGDQQAG